MTDSTGVVIDGSSVSSGTSSTLSLESFNANSVAQSALKSDSIEVLYTSLTRSTALCTEIVVANDISDSSVVVEVEFAKLEHALSAGTAFESRMRQGTGPLGFVSLSNESGGTTKVIFNAAS